MGYRYDFDRNYLNGYFNALKSLEAQNKIGMSKEVRLMGSVYHDGWVHVSWKKVN